MATKKTSAAPTRPQPDPEIADPAYPHAVEAPYRAGWEHALTAKYGTRGKSWTSTKSEPQWTIRFKEGDAAAWFKKTWATAAT